MIEEIIFYGIGILSIYFFYRIIKSQMTFKNSCTMCTKNCSIDNRKEVKILFSKQI